MFWVGFVADSANSDRSHKLCTEHSTCQAQITGVPCPSLRHVIDAEQHNSLRIVRRLLVTCRSCFGHGCADVSASAIVHATRMGSRRQELYQPVCVRSVQQAFS